MTIPTDMTEVTKEEFFAIMGPRDVHPRALPDCSEWETRERRIIGRSYPGYKYDVAIWGALPTHRYFVVPALVRLSAALVRDRDQGDGSATS